MSNLKRALRALGREEMLECARGLLECLTGSGTQAAARGQALRRSGPAGRGDGGSGAEPAAGAERMRRGVRSPGAGGRGRRAGEGAEAAERAARGFDVPEGAGRGGPEDARGPEGIDRRGSGARDLAGSVRADAASAEFDPARSAAFCGPERRYENAVGARGMEMSRVSEFFKRDSRRYGELK